LILPIGCLLLVHKYENSQINKYIEQNRFQYLPISKRSAFIISDSLRKLFNVNISTWSSNQNFNKEPYFRKSVLTLLQDKEAVCGGGARVLCRILQHLGYDATRVVLYSKNFGASGHVVVSILLNGKEYFIDTLNSDSELNYILKTYDINTTTINIIPYKSRYINPSYYLQESHFYPVKMFQTKYIAYSYEAIPLSKISNSLGFGLYVLNTNRPYKIFSSLAESVYMIYLSIYLILLFLSLIILRIILKYSRVVRPRLFDS